MNSPASASLPVNTTASGQTQLDAPPAKPSPGALKALSPFLRPYRGRIVLALMALIMAAVTTLVLPIALRELIDNGMLPKDPGERIVALRTHFLALGGVGIALGVFSALRYYSGWASAWRLTSKAPSMRMCWSKAPSFLKPPRPVKCSRA
jgi:ATP-binding cassette subfamily B protein